VLEQSANLLKARIYISDTLFIQVYRNDRFDTTSLALIYNSARIYARDQLGGKWHRHEYQSLESHDTSPAGRKAMTFAEYLDEVETLLAELGLP